MGYSNSLCLMDVEYEFTTLIVGEHSITNIVRGFTIIPSHLLLYIF